MSHLNKDAKRVYVPSTFESMMHDFGTRVNRRELLTLYDKACDKSYEAYREEKPQEALKEFYDVYKQLHQNTR